MPVKKPNVTIVIPHAVQLFYPRLIHRQGGAEVQFALLARELAREGSVRPAVILGNYGQPAEDEIDGVRLISFLHKGGWRGRLSLFRALRRAAGAAIVQTCAGSVTANVALYHALSHTPFIYWAASDPDCDPNAIPGVTDPLHTRAFEWGLRQANAIITQHEGQSELLRRYMGREPVAVIPNGWPPQPQPSAERRHHLWVGHPTRWKNPEGLLDIAAALPLERFLMVMPMEKSEPDVEARVRERLKDLPNVECRPRVPFAEMEGLYAGAKTLVMTSLAEGFPNVMLQALWCGAPILSLHVDPGLMITRNRLGLFTRGDAAALTDGLRRWSERPEEWREYSERAYAYAAAELSVSRLAGRFLDALRRMGILP